MNLRHSNFWAEQMKKTPFVELEKIPGDPVYHAEGNVLIHTQMVLAELENMSEFKDLSESEQVILRLAALFHDTGKQTTWQEIDGRVSYQGHSRESAKIFYQYLWKAGYDNITVEERKQVSGLIFCHSWPPNLLSGTKQAKSYPPEAHIINSSQHCKNNLLQMLAKADMLGRVSKINTSDRLAIIELYGTTAKDLNCLMTQYKFNNKHARYKFLNSISGNWQYQAFDDTKMTLHLIMGVPGSGKTTYRTANFGNLPYISLDEIRIELGLPPGESTHKTLVPAYERFRSILRKHTNCVWDAVNVRYDIRRQILSLAHSYGAKTKIHFIDEDSQACHKGNKSRDARIPDRIVDSIAHSMQLAKQSESHELLWL